MARSRKKVEYPEEIAKATAMVLFHQRLIHEGWDLRYNQEAKEASDKRGVKTGPQALMEVKRRGPWFYKNVADERAKAFERYKEKHLQSDGAERRAIRAEKRAEKKVRSFAEAMADLPDTSPEEEELNWIRSHEAMTRLARGVHDEEERVKITVEDITDASNGPAPSKGAVIALQNWCQRPEVFFKQMVDEQRKQKNDDSERGVNVKQEMMDLREAEILLDSLRYMDES